MAPPTAEGVLLVDKSAGMTSHDVVGVARRALGERGIGHAGTLDPFATGLLVLMVGRATRLLPYVSGEPKVYDATIRFGVETTTDDLDGEVLREAPAPSPDAIAAALPVLTGAIDQVPPRYSAKKVGGVRAYAAARRGEPLTLQPARVVVHRWQIRAQRENELDVTITCGGGTYIRALARDLGRSSGSAAHLASLRRVRSGAFDVADATSVEALRSGLVPRLLPLRAAVPELPAQVLSDDEVRRIGQGQVVPAAAKDEAMIALLDASGLLVAIAHRDAGGLHPRMVLRAG